MTTFDKIKKISKEKGYSLSSVNEKAGLGTNVIYGWKTKKPDYENVKKVADVLGVSVDYLLGNTDEMHPKQVTGDPDVDGVDLNDYFKKRGLLRFNGKPIPEEDLRIIYRILETGEED
ncbi:XRE family transcriptional regulator [Weissella viridescens]|uniref:XRE family transcriptional regulator n=1 Tax=Weissella viridescens TaxID=1629 RepID=A0A3P2RBV9_WEIVI|nr:helix-turn-helix transcriptional regulator [Weissella viridescens]RRG18229.1 XRE family transcriptional regulator [Weissella viridescens]